MCSTSRQTTRPKPGASSVRTLRVGRISTDDMQRANALIAAVDIALYEGRPEAAVMAIRSDWDLVTRSQLLRLPTTFTFSYAARGRASLALASASAVDPRVRQALLGEASESAQVIRQKGPAWGRGLAMLLLAGVARSHGHNVRAKDLLIEAEAALTAAELTPYLMAARWRLASIDRRSETRALEASAAEWAAREQVLRPERVFSALAPGDWR